MLYFYSIQFVHVSWKSKRAGQHVPAKALSVLSIGKGCLMNLDSLSFSAVWGGYLTFTQQCNTVDSWSSLMHNKPHIFFCKTATWSTFYICIANYSCLGAEPCLCPHWINILCFSSDFPFVKFIWIPSLSSSLFVVPTSFVICRFKNSLRFHNSILKTKVLILGTHPNLETQCSQEMHSILKQWTLRNFEISVPKWCEPLGTMLV